MKVNTRITRNTNERFFVPHLTVLRYPTDVKNGTTQGNGEIEEKPVFSANGRAKGLHSLSASDTDETEEINRRLLQKRNV